MLNKPLTKEILARLHQKTHWGTPALCDEFFTNYGCIGVFGLAKQVTENCGVYQKVNKKVMRRVTLGCWDLALRPFQSIQVDFTELPQI